MGERADYEKLSKRLAGDNWRTPNTYCNLFMEPKLEPAVYMFIGFLDHPEQDVVVSYVGMSEKLSQRLASHPALAEISKTFNYVQTWFKPTLVEYLREVELSYIQEFDPPWNVQGRRRGVVSI
ncbi:GIY-YIG nuclease family protein [uncultured Roseibium sp.]|uniref:GIY-YIG nuclease family protein n=1 Tax=uncultured Roseibium sp. TaxID=1936171 RepID=UPI00262E46E3|nr:GIY-YIG nuclease family protein [uncultured Roseibium sp.]